MSWLRLGEEFIEEKAVRVRKIRGMGQLVLGRRRLYRALSRILAKSSKIHVVDLKNTWESISKLCSQNHDCIQDKIGKVTSFLRPTHSKLCRIIGIIEDTENPHHLRLARGIGLRIVVVPGSLTKEASSISMTEETYWIINYLLNKIRQHIRRRKDHDHTREVLLITGYTSPIILNLSKLPYTDNLTIGIVGDISRVDFSDYETIHKIKIFFIR